MALRCMLCAPWKYSVRLIGARLGSVREGRAAGAGPRMVPARRSILIRHMKSVPRNERDAGQVSHLLLGLPDDDYPMSITIVEAAPGSQQPLHAHPESTQVYLVIAGSGRHPQHRRPHADLCISHRPAFPRAALMDRSGSQPIDGRTQYDH